MSTNMEQWDLAPGEPLSQDSNARGFSSQMLDCPSAPYNSEDPDYSDTPVECMPGLTKASPLEETFDDNEVAVQHNSILFQRHPIQSPPCANLQENDADSHWKLSSVVSKLVGCYPQSLCDRKVSEEDMLSAMGSEDCCPRILCDPKLLEEDTQEDMEMYNPDPSDILLPGKPLSLMIQDGIPSKTPLTASQPVHGIPSANALSEAYSIPDDDIIRRWENRKRKALFETTNRSSHLETSSCNVTINKSNQPVVLEMVEDVLSQKEVAVRPMFDDKENCRMPRVSACTSPTISIPSSPNASHDVQCIDLTGDSVDVIKSAQKPKRLRTSDLKCLWPQSTLERNTHPEALVNPSTPEQQNAGGWVCPKLKKSGGKMRQRTMDSWMR